MVRKRTPLVWLLVALLAVVLVILQLPTGERRASASNGGESLLDQLKARTASRPNVEVPAGTHLHVRLKEKITTRNREGDAFVGRLDRPLEGRGRTLAPAGTCVTGRLTVLAEKTGRAGSTEVSMVLEQMVLDDSVFRLDSEPLTLLIPADPATPAESSPLRKEFRERPAADQRLPGFKDQDVFYQAETRLTFVLAERLLLPVFGRSN